MTDWVKKAGQAKIREKAQAMLTVLLQAKFGKETEILDFPRMSVILGRELGATLREVVNQCQNGQGMISAAELYLIANELDGQP